MTTALMDGLLATRFSVRSSSRAMDSVNVLAEPWFKAIVAMPSLTSTWMPSFLPQDGKPKTRMSSTT